MEVMSGQNLRFIFALHKLSERISLIIQRLYFATPHYRFFFHTKYTHATIQQVLSS